MTGSIRTLGAFRGYLAIPPPSPGDLLDSRCVQRLPPVGRQPHGCRGAVGRHTLGVRDYLDSLRQFWRRLPRNALIGEWWVAGGSGTPTSPRCVSPPPPWAARGLFPPYPCQNRRQCSTVRGRSSRNCGGDRGTTHRRRGSPQRVLARDRPSE